MLSVNTFSLALLAGFLWDFTVADGTPGICRAQKRSVAELTAICPAVTLERASDFWPWTHAPFCLRSKNKWNDDFCVYTNADFRSGRGISIIAEMETAMRIARESAAGIPELQSASNAIEEVPYEEREDLERGVGLYAKKDHSIKAGRTILVDYPSIAIHREALMWFSPEDREELQWLAVLQLPDESRRRVRGLSRQGGESDAVSDIMKTNSIGQKFGEDRFLSIFPAIAVRANDQLLRF
jgi:hypothetical protein